MGSRILLLKMLQKTNELSDLKADHQLEIEMMQGRCVVPSWGSLDVSLDASDLHFPAISAWPKVVFALPPSSDFSHCSLCAAVDDKIHWIHWNHLLQGPPNDL